MFTANREFDFECTPDQAFTHVAREFFANKPRWDPDITELIKTSQGEVAVGTTGRETRRAGGRNYVTTFVFTEFEPERRFVHQARRERWRRTQRTRSGLTTPALI
jgi:hypothetical protein